MEGSSLNNDKVSIILLCKIYDFSNLEAERD
jgi:hypothetical protein